MRLSALHQLHAGPLTLTYDNGSIRYVRLGARETLRGIGVAVRDENWLTVPANLSDESIEAGTDWFRIRFRAEHIEGGVDFAWEGSIEGDSSGAIRYSLSGAARRAFRRNRIGIYVLHPIRECAGAPCRIEHSNGEWKPAVFPDTVSPHQPFFDIRAMRHQVIPGLVAEVRFSGDVFETEDHRNWSDASFKTYSTPLALPRPVLLTEGTRIEQTAELTLHTDEAVSLTVNSADRRRMPPIGAVWHPGTLPMVLDYLRVDLPSHDPSWPDRLRDASQYGVPLEIALFTDAAQSYLEALRDEFARLTINPIRVLVFSPDGNPATPEAVISARSCFASIPICGGSNINFAELNRNRDAVLALDGVAWPITPQWHAADDLTAIENLGSVHSMAQTARTFAGHRPLHISPVLAPSFRAEAGWIAIMFRNLVLSGVASVTFDTTHPILGEIRSLAPADVIASSSSDELRADCLMIGSVSWLANFLPVPQTVVMGRRSLELAPDSAVRFKGAIGQ